MKATQFQILAIQYGVLGVNPLLFSIALQQHRYVEAPEQEMFGFCNEGIKT